MLLTNRSAFFPFPETSSAKLRVPCKIFAGFKAKWPSVWRDYTLCMSLYHQMGNRGVKPTYCNLSERIGNTLLLKSKETMFHKQRLEQTILLEGVVTAATSVPAHTVITRDTSQIVLTQKSETSRDTRSGRERNKTIRIMKRFTSRAFLMLRSYHSDIVSVSLFNLFL